MYTMKQLRSMHRKRYITVTTETVKKKEVKIRTRNEDYIPFKVWLRAQELKENELPPKAKSILGLDKEEREAATAERKEKRRRLRAERVARRKTGKPSK